MVQSFQYDQAFSQVNFFTTTKAATVSHREIRSILKLRSLGYNDTESFFNLESTMLFCTLPRLHCKVALLPIFFKTAFDFVGVVDILQDRVCIKWFTVSKLNYRANGISV